MRACAVIVLSFVTLIGIGAVAGCRRGDATPETETPTPTKVRAPRETNHQVFAPFRSLIEVSDLTLPFLLSNDEDLLEVPCFQPIDDVIAAEVTSDVAEPLEQHERAISKLLREWVQRQVAPTAVSDALIETWTIAPNEVGSIEIDDTMVRFAEDEECVDSSTGWMERDVRVVAGLFGARSFDFTARTPISRSKAEALLQEFELAGFEVETEDFTDYEIVTEGNGEPRLGEKGEKLYRHPELGVVSEHEITPPDRQRMKNWTAVAPSPVYFGYRELAKVAWQRESSRDECNVNLVWQDPAFREPDCAEYRGTGFKAARRDGRIAIRMKTGDDEQSFEMDSKTVKRIRVNDRAILWISPVTIEEGVLIRVNSLVLNP